MTVPHLAQLNIARLLAPLDSEQLAGFVARLAEINTLADAAPGFVWRFETEDGDATSVRPYDDERVIVNLSVWETPEQLHAFVYRSAHAEVMRHRRDWFARPTEAYTVLWWVPAGHHPSVDEACERLARLREEGESPAAFTFKRIFPPPGQEPGRRPETLADECPAQ
jgi:heme-degrading monooxygenase HmoA